MLSSKTTTNMMLEMYVGGFLPLSADRAISLRQTLCSPALSICLVEETLGPWIMAFLLVRLITRRMCCEYARLKFEIRSERYVSNDYAG